VCAAEQQLGTGFNAVTIDVNVAVRHNARRSSGALYSVNLTLASQFGVDFSQQYTAVARFFETVSLEAAQQAIRELVPVVGFEAGEEAFSTVILTRAPLSNTSVALLESSPKIVSVGKLGALVSSCCSS
jgi:hypothetical protein